MGVATLLGRLRPLDRHERCTSALYRSEVENRSRPDGVRQAHEVTTPSVGSTGVLHTPVAFLHRMLPYVLTLPRCSGRSPTSGYAGHYSAKGSPRHDSRPGSNSFLGTAVPRRSCDPLHRRWTAGCASDLECRIGPASDRK